MRIGKVCSVRMTGVSGTFNRVEDMLAAWRPPHPVYCIYPRVYRETARAFVAGFSGRVLYAVKANDDRSVIRALADGGIRHFDCASLAEIETVRDVCPQAKCYLMVPVAPRGDLREAQQKHDLRHFMVDHDDGLDSLANEVELARCVVFVRMAVSHQAAEMDLSSKFGASPEVVPVLLAQIRTLGAEPALAFNVGTLVTHPDAYRHAISTAGDVLGRVGFPLRLVDIGGGFPRAYPDYPVPPMDDYFDAVRSVSGQLPLAKNGELLAEPGRALSAPGLSAVVEVLMRKDGRLYLNDGMYGIFWELRFEAHKRFPVRAFRDGKRLQGPKAEFRLYGPTCDASDVLPATVPLPESIRKGDYLEFGHIGAYSLSGRTRFNGHYSDCLVEIRGNARPPGEDG